MKAKLSTIKQLLQLGLVLMMGISMSACSKTTWKEEVLLHDGSKISVKRSQTHGGRHEIGQDAPIKEHSITFTMPGSGNTITWTSEYGEDIGRTNFNALALHILGSAAYVIARPNLCLSYNKWGRPNPPYVVFKHVGKEWQRISLSELPGEFTTVNLAISTLNDESKLTALGFVSAEQVAELNSDSKVPEFKTILREPLEKKQLCEELVFYKGAWVGPGNSIGKQMLDMKNK